MHVQEKEDTKLGIKDVPENCDICQCTMMMSQYALLRVVSTLHCVPTRARNWNSAGMRIRPPRSPEPSASGASKWAGVDDGSLPSLSQMQMFVAATVLVGGCQEVMRIRPLAIS